MIQTSRKFIAPGGWRSLQFRLSAALVATVVLVVAFSTAIDYVHERDTHRHALLASLEEQAHAIRVASKKIEDPDAFASFVDDFCAHMNARVSPGHHILVLDASGGVITGSRRHSGVAVEHALLAADPGEKIIEIDGREMAQVRVAGAAGRTFVLAQYLDPMKRLLRRQVLGRALSAATIAVLIVGFIMVVVRAWVLKPLSRLRTAAQFWSRREFSARAETTGPDDIRVLAEEFNTMASELESQELSRMADLNRARLIQLELLPSHLPDVPGLRTGAEYRPAEDVAGDLYDIIPLPNGRSAFVVIDVAGHGIGAALLTGVVKMSLRWHLAEGDDLSGAMAHVNRDLLGHALSEHFATVCVAVWDPEPGVWTWCAGGHPGGIVLSGRTARHLEATGPLLGVIGAATWQQQTVRLKAGDRTFLYTDGLTDAGAPTAPLGQNALEELLLQTSDRDIDRQVGQVVEEALRRWNGRPTDDVTLVGVEIVTLPAPHGAGR